MRASALAAVLAVLSHPFVSRSALAELPQSMNQIHLGPSSCAGAPCHGSGAAVGPVVQQDEHTTWLRHDRHARAYLVLREERSQRIARNLGLAEPAHESKLCLDCHADHVPPERRGPQFSLEEGVGCEACHGGSGGPPGSPPGNSGWLRPHQARDRGHASNVALGMYPTDDPVARAELCLSCHFGTSEKFVDHRLMGAGHPRMSFELDTFSQVQPAHFRIDEDFRERGKAVPPGVTIWAVGQAVQVAKTMEALADPVRGRDGAFPELVLFDCHACHHPMSDPRWVPRSTLGDAARPGTPRLQDASLLVLRHPLAMLAPGAAVRLRTETLALHAALGRDFEEARKVAGRIAALGREQLPALAAWRPDVSEVRALAKRLIDEGLAGQYRDYAAAEQVTMALQSLAATLQKQGVLDAGRVARINGEIEALLRVTADDEAYVPAALPVVLRRIASELR